VEERKAGQAAVSQPLLPNLRERVRSAPRTAQDVATGVAVRALVGSRLVVWLASFVAMATFGRNLEAMAVNDPNHLTQPFHAAWANFLFAPGARWDSVWYLHIAQAGYFAPPASAFFPLYPLLIHLGAAVFGSAALVGALISFGSLLAALYLLYLLVRLDFSDQVARTTVLLLACFPTTVFLSAVYSESLFLMLSVGAVYAARRERWAWAGILGCLAASSRSNGVLIALPLALIYLYGPRPGAATRLVAGRWQPRYRLSWSSIWILLVPLGLIAYLVYLWITHDAPLAPFQAEQFWSREFVGPFGAVIHLALALPHDLHRIFSGSTLPVEPGDPISWTTHDLIDLGFLVFAFLGLAWSWRRVPTAYFVYALVMLAQTLSDPSSVEPLASFSRYVLVIFPLFIGWAVKLENSRAARRAVLAASVVLMAGFSGLWAVWAWVA